MIATLTLNAALDVTFHVEHLVPGRRVATAAPGVQAGGKGVNVSRVLHALGVPTLAVVVIGGRTGRRIVEDLEGSGIRHLAVECPGESRTCLEVVEPGPTRATQLHGGGVRADQDTLARVLRALSGLPPETRWLACCGSLPEAMPPSAAAQVVRHARDRGLRVAVDTRSPALRPAAEAAPDLLRINRDELAEALGCERGRLDEGSEPPLGRPGATVISDGAQPVVCWRAGCAPIRLAPPAVDAVNPIGCGDAMLAGLLDGLGSGRPLEEALRWATALAAAEAASPVAARPDLARARALLASVRTLPGP